MPPRQSAGHAPLRHPESIRRTSHIDVTWPQGREANTLFEGRARDILTWAADQQPSVIQEDSFTAQLSTDRTIKSIDTYPNRPQITQLCGERSGSNLRKAITGSLPDEFAHGTPLYLLLDDIAGTSLISGWAWSHWIPDWHEQVARAKAAREVSMEGVCIGFRPGSGALINTPRVEIDAPTPELAHPDDPQGWHEMNTQQNVNMRRARRIDVWRHDDIIHIDAAFQDSAISPKGRLVLHEYRIVAQADPVTLCLTQLQAIPCVLPFSECTSAPHNMARLVGKQLDTLRESVLQELAKTAGCTHLNDALRALAEAPILTQKIWG